MYNDDTKKKSPPPPNYSVAFQGRNLSDSELFAHLVEQRHTASEKAKKYELEKKQLDEEINNLIQFMPDKGLGLRVLVPVPDMELGEQCQLVVRKAGGSNSTIKLEKLVEQGIPIDKIKKATVTVQYTYLQTAVYKGDGDNATGE